MEIVMRTGAKVVIFLALGCQLFGGNGYVKETILEDIQENNHEHLCRYLRKNINKTISFNGILNLAAKNGLQDLLEEAWATKNLNITKQRLGISKGELLSIIHYINALADNHTIHYSKSYTGLSHSLEYDPDTKNYFIVLEGKGVYLDGGKKKNVTKAICVRNNKAKVVARADQIIPMDVEIAFTKKLSGKPGLFKSLGVTRHTSKNVEHYTIYSELYIPGSLQKVFMGNYQLTLYEKVCLAYDIAEGLNTLHKKGIVHRDLGIKNYLVNISKGRPGKRQVDACIADFGRTLYVNDVPRDDRLQGNTTYLAPEGHEFPTKSNIDHYKLDIFALGCVFYRLFYEEKAPWQLVSYVKEKDARSLEERMSEHKSHVDSFTAKRRQELSKKRTLTHKEEFEYLILRMLDTNPKKRVDAKEVYDTLSKLV
jgi:serine/threonine protein kinase